MNSYGPWGRILVPSAGTDSHPHPGTHVLCSTRRTAVLGKEAHACRPQAFAVHSPHKGSESKWVCRGMLTSWTVFTAVMATIRLVLVDLEHILKWEEQRRGKII